jgi:ethanolamine utilization protein EutQ (cupin superfamily)
MSEPEARPIPFRSIQDQDEIPKVRINPQGEQRVSKTKRGTLVYLGDAIWYKEGVVLLENFVAGETMKWTFWFDEVQYILAGKAEMHYLLPASRFSVEKHMTVEAGDALLIPKGADVTWKIDPSGPLTKFCVIMPGFKPYDPRHMAPEARGGVFHAGE